MLNPTELGLRTFEQGDQRLSDPQRVFIYRKVIRADGLLFVWSVAEHSTDICEIVTLIFHPNQGGAL